jgi:hypothetical protein|uniref:KTSC domain n=1 Tax=Myoviridae sp. ctSyg22 TaxID=2823545 RepID=A0A8S5L928_9CAUD|nr:MAG TPA: KTSC domain [Myoviridae sp. ctSyg22]DAN39455.1 MAG TPA: KTSC domain [Bacteriophage sp.]DAP62714.1 MAG TPA: KTSC domain [Caudoviricetes sp.]
MLQMILVSSSNVHSVGYDKNTSTLYVKFHSGQTYAYYSVPEFHYTGLLNASSVGSYLDTYIKKGGYTYRKC